MAEALPILALDGDHRYMIAKGRLDSEKTPTQVRANQAKRFFGTPCGFLRKLFHRIGSPPGPQQSVAFNDLLQGSQHNWLAGRSSRESRRSCGAKAMNATRARKKICEFFRHPL